jgi:hypothetical protein
MAGIEPHIEALCCYKERAVLSSRCVVCKWAYSCPTFTSAAEVKRFYGLIPRPMRGEPLPVELWPVIVDNFVIELVRSGVVKVDGSQWDGSAVRRLLAVIEGGGQSGGAAK